MSINFIDCYLLQFAITLPIEYWWVTSVHSCGFAV